MDENTMDIQITETGLTEQKPLPMTAKGVFSNAEQFELAQRMAQLLASSDCVPSGYRGNLPNCVIALDVANRMGISPLTVMQNLYIVKGKPSWSGQACRALIEGCGRFTNVTPVYVGQAGSMDWGCYFQATNKSTGQPVKGTTVTMQMAQAEGWLSKDGSKWRTMPEQMLAYRAAAFFARVHCPSALMGFQTVEEVNDIENNTPAPKPRTVNINEI